MKICNTHKVILTHTKKFQFFRLSDFLIFFISVINLKNQIKKLLIQNQPKKQKINSNKI